MENIKNNIIEYIIRSDGDVHFNHLVKLGCYKSEAAKILEILSRSEMVDLYNDCSEISTYAKNLLLKRQ